MENESYKQFACGFVCCAMICGAISLEEKDAALLALHGRKVPLHLKFWWLDTHTDSQ